MVVMFKQLLPAFTCLEAAYWRSLFLNYHYNIRVNNVLLRILFSSLFVILVFLIFVLFLILMFIATVTFTTKKDF